MYGEDQVGPAVVDQIDPSLRFVLGVLKDSIATHILLAYEDCAIGIARHHHLKSPSHELIAHQKA